MIFLSTDLKKKKKTIDFEKAKNKIMETIFICNCKVYWQK